MRRATFILYAILFFLVPLVLWPYTSEVFEFNKMVLVYILTALIAASWLTQSIVARKFIFRRTILDTPLLIFLGSQFLSTILSIDPYTSWLGYYSRFNGGLLSSICYAILYWAFVSNFGKDDAIKLIKYALLPGAALVSLYGVFEHFGIDKSIWVQDVQSRVFSTLGQPNWLAAWLVALMPITWAFLLDEKIKSKNFWLYFGLSVLFFWTLIFTKSRSGYLGVAAAFIIFWGFRFWSVKEKIKELINPFLLVGFSILAICLISGTEYTPSLYSLINKPKTAPVTQVGGDTALETGGTESSTIRKIVWSGAIQIWLHYPIFGTGVETFAYSYYKYRPVAHNLTSEWDFIYNKAHNEFLNMAANAGTVGLLSYLALIGFSVWIFVDKFRTFDKLKIALLAGFLSLSVTNFFGFSVVSTQLEFFLFPAIAIVLGTEYKVPSSEKHKISNAQNILIFFVLGTMFYVLFAIGKYWYADILYNKGYAYNRIQKQNSAVSYLESAINLEPSQAIYHNELATSLATLAVYYDQQKDSTKSAGLTNLAVGESDKAISLSSANLNLKRSRFGIFVMLASIDPNYLIKARDVLIDAITYAPTDAKLYYNLGLIYARTGQTDLAITTLQKTIELKSNYKDAHLALAYLLIEKKDNAGARVQLEYILKYISPNDSLTKQALESVK